MVATVGGLAGARIAPSPTWANFPIAAMMLGTATLTIPASLWMARVGRRIGFLTGAFLGVLAGLVAALGIRLESLPLLATGTYSPTEKSKAQAIHDMSVFAIGLACSFSAGGPLASLGWARMNLILLPWLAAAALAIAWLWFRHTAKKRAVART